MFIQAALLGLQQESELYGLFLNMAKCGIMIYEQNRNSRTPSLFFESGEQVKVTSKEMYLGGQITAQYNTSYEVGRRIALGQHAYRERKRIFRDSKISIYRKLQIYEACVSTKVMHGLETLNINKRDIQKITNL